MCKKIGITRRKNIESMSKWMERKYVHRDGKMFNASKIISKTAIFFYLFMEPHQCIHSRIDLKFKFLFFYFLIFLCLLSSAKRFTLAFNSLFMISLELFPALLPRVIDNLFFIGTFEYTYSGCCVYWKKTSLLFENFEGKL